MSTLSLRKIKHDSSAVDNISLDSTGNTGFGTDTPLSTYNAKIVSVAPSTQAALALDAASGTNTAINYHTNGTVKWTQQVLTTGEFRWYNFTNSAEYMRIDGSGRVTTPYQPAFFVTNGSWTSSVKRWHSGNVNLNRGGHYDSSTGRFTAPVAGAYQFICTVQGHAPAGTAGRDATYYNLQPHVNGSNAINGEIVATCQESNGTKHDQITCNSIFYLNAGDYVTIESSYGFRVGTQSVYSGHLLG